METKKKEELQTLEKEELISYIEELTKVYEDSELMKGYYRNDFVKLKKKLEIIYGVVELSKD